MSDFDDTASDFYAEQRKESQERRKRNREQSTRLLRDAGITFTEHNKGAHLIVAGRYDFYPGTGLWKARGDKTKQRGVRELIKRIKGAAA